MSDIVIKAESLGKKYTIGHQSSQERYYALRDVMARNLKGLWQNARDIWSGKKVIQGDEVEEFWALKDVNFEIRQGEAVGIIGRNGAGKSTLLKVLSRITEPSAGKVTIKGRVASLLEVGTGFHPELTGRENVYLNGAILGMSRREIRSKFDEIVDFAEVEKFLDTPVKRYSSGMYVRLAFAVAAHLEPDILVVDEVLAVGDILFQKKCLGKMANISKTDRTILFVSHNLQAIKTLCSRSVLLDTGEIVIDGPTQTVIDHYKSSLGHFNLADQARHVDFNIRRGSGEARFTSITASNRDGIEGFEFDMWDNITFEMSYQVNLNVLELLVYIGIRSEKSKEIITSAKHFISNSPMLKGATGKIMLEFPECSLRPGEYPLYFWLGDSSYRMQYESFDILDNLTPPLVIRVNQKRPSLDVDPEVPSGFFSMKSCLRCVAS